MGNEPTQEDLEKMNLRCIKKQLDKIITNDLHHLKENVEENNKRLSLIEAMLSTLRTVVARVSGSMFVIIPLVIAVLVGIAGIYILIFSLHGFG